MPREVPAGMISCSLEDGWVSLYPPHRSPIRLCWIPYELRGLEQTSGQHVFAMIGALGERIVVLNFAKLFAHLQWLSMNDDWDMFC
jgi:hypothetical protein